MIPLFDNIRTTRPSLANYLIIGANLAVFSYELSLGPGLGRFIVQWGMTPALVTTYLTSWQGASAREAATLFTSMFMHASWGHILGNIVFLWVFGHNVEDAMGRWRYLFFYLLGGLGAAATQILVGADSLVPTLGASGAISGVLGGYLVLYPRARVSSLVPLLFFFTIIRVPAVIFLGLWFVFQFLTGLATLAYAGGAVGGVAWWAHIGGFVTGLLLVNIFRRHSRYRVLTY